MRYIEIQEMFFAHVESPFLFKNYPMCTKSIFAHQDWNKLHDKIICINIIVLKAQGGQILVFGDIVFALKHRKFLCGMHLTVVLKGSITILYL